MREGGRSIFHVLEEVQVHFSIAKADLVDRGVPVVHRRPLLVSLLEVLDVTLLFLLSANLHDVVTV